MKQGLGHIVGKRIAAVVVARNKGRAPATQVFLVFSDGTRFEFYGADFTCCAGLDRAGDIDRYVASARGEVVRIHAEGPDRLEDLMRRDLEAWQAAKAAIDKAKARR